MSQIHGALRAIRRRFRVYFKVFLPQVGVALATFRVEMATFRVGGGDEISALETPFVPR